MTARSKRPGSVPLSIVVVAYDMARELPRTLRSLSPAYQRGVDGAEFEVIVVDNGSPEPLDPRMLASFPGRLRSERLDPAPVSPARAANIGLELADGEIVGLLIDGARLASPGLLAHAGLGARLADRPVVATMAWHLGPEHMGAAELGYDRDAEDRLLAEIEWEQDGYRLFEVSTLAGSSRRGWFGSLGESNALFTTREVWTELGGLDESFETPGGGRVNHDLYHRACALDGARLIMLLGEGTFHQIHGGATTSRRYDRDEMEKEYEALRGRPFAPPGAEPLYLGTVPTPALGHLERSVQWAIRASGRNTRPVTGFASGTLPG